MDGWRQGVMVEVDVVVVRMGVEESGKEAKSVLVIYNFSGPASGLFKLLPASSIMTSSIIDYAPWTISLGRLRFLISILGSSDRAGS